MDDGDDGALRNGLPIQVHAYVSPSPATPEFDPKRPVDASIFRVKDGKTIELVNGSESLSAAMSHVYYQPPGTEQDVIERSLQPLVKACVEGVNASVLAVGALRSGKSELLFRRIKERSLAAALCQSLLAAVESKAGTVNASGGRSRMTFSLTVAFVEIYEETVRDLLLTRGSNARRARVVEGVQTFKTLQDTTISPPITSAEVFKQIVQSAIEGRSRENGLYGNATEFTSAVLRLHVRQTFEFQDAPTQQLLSTFDIVDLPMTDRLASTGGMTRLSEGPLLNKSLYALSDCVSVLSESQDQNAMRQPPYDESRLTELLQDSLGGNCLTFALLFLSPGNAIGSRATLQLGKRLQGIKTFPVVNNDVVRGLHRKFFSHLNHVRHSAVAINRNAGDGGSYVGRIHELEGRLAQEVLEKKLLREDKDKIVAVMNELKLKYQQLFDNEIEIRKELLACEQEKLSLSKAFVDFQMEKNSQLQDLDNDKFELESKLIKAEEVLVQVQQDDHKKASQIQDLCQKMNELIHDKRTLAEELALLQKHCQELEQTTKHETKKNQQLSLELLVLVNQKQKHASEMEASERRQRELTKRVNDHESKQQAHKMDQEAHTQKILQLETDLETMRKELARKAIEIERLELGKRKAEIEFERQAEGQVRDRTSETEKELVKARALVTAMENEKLLLQQQAARSDAEVQRGIKEREELMAAWLVKGQENEELLVANERLQHENQSQMEEFRLKLSFLTGAKANDASQAMAELLQSYQRRERDLRAQVSTYQSRFARLKKHQAASVPGVVESTEADRGSLDEATSEQLTELTTKLHTAEFEIVRLREEVHSLTASEGDAQRRIEALQREVDEAARREQTARTADQASLEATRQLQSLILQQLDEVRRLAVAAPPPKAPRPETPEARTANVTSPPPPPASHAASGMSEAEWLQNLEQVERRCADLLTKNVMLTEENHQLRTTLKSLMTRIHARR